ncbi:MAG: peptidoglycan DD-metalloendopeptidase family protein [Candidatus Omnitrophica bacterium]|nr:peptidoglycan DD-metalloendopeptidase family protein [Candidatus Omnitrophota bacterium]
MFHTRYGFLFVFLLATLSIAGCATTSYHPSDTMRTSVPGFYHEVQRGQTLWHISKIYDVNFEKLISANHLPDASKIEVGQLIFIPNKSKEALGGSRIEKSKTFENFIWPVRGTVVSYFGSTKDLVKNKGIDIEARELAGVAASRSGRVTFASDNLKGYGKTIIIDHRDGFQTVYAYNAQNLVTLDQAVKQGEIIAKVGRTGRAAKPMLHFEVRKNHEPQNPFYYLP